MCQTTSKSSKVRTAERDITVWKVVKVAWNHSKSSRQDIIPNACNPSIKYLYLYRKGHIQNGPFQGRAFNDRIYRMRNSDSIPRQIWPVAINLGPEGFHSFVAKDQAQWLAKTQREKLGRFTIPKGARYIEGWDGGNRDTRVSSKIRFDGFVK